MRTAVCSGWPLCVHTSTTVPYTPWGTWLVMYESKESKRRSVTDRQKETRTKTGGSATASVSKARVSENRGAAIQMDNTTGNKQQQQWQLHLPAAGFHMLMLVFLPANSTLKTMCVCLFASVYSKWSDALWTPCHMVLVIRIIWQGTETHAHEHT